MTKTKETTVQSPSVGADGEPPSKMYTPISAETANRFTHRSVVEPPPRDDARRLRRCYWGWYFIVAPLRREKAGPQNWNQLILIV